MCLLEITKSRREDPHRKVHPKHLNLNSRNPNYARLQSSLFHQTAKREILPLVGVASLIFIGRYSYKALVRMDEEWEEYQLALEEGGYSSSSQGTSSTSSSNNHFYRGSIGIDLGSYNLRLSHLAKSNSDSLQKNPAIIENREGSRTTPALIVFDGESNGDESFLFGSMAKSKLYERTMYSNLPPIQFIHEQLSSSNDEAVNKNVNFFLSSVISNALERVPGVNGQSNIPKDSIFSLDANTGGGIQPVFTYNPSMSNQAKQAYQSAIHSITSPPSIATFVPEPIAAVVGSKHFGIFSSSQNGPVAVVDVGGHVISLTIIEPNPNEKFKNKILHHTAISNTAGNALQTALVNLMKKDFFDAEESTAPPDGMAMQRLYDASEMAVMELSKNSRTNINIPYITVDTKTMEPKHLEMGISRNVLKKEMDDLVSNELEDKDALNSSLTGPAKNLSALITQMFLNAMEQANMNPFLLEGVLLVGGGARSPIFQLAMKKGLAGLGGEAYADEKLVIPKGELVEDLVALGAAVCGEDENIELDHVINQD